MDVRPSGQDGLVGFFKMLLYFILYFHVYTIPVEGLREHLLPTEATTPSVNWLVVRSVAG